MHEAGLEHCRPGRTLAQWCRAATKEALACQRERKKPGKEYAIGKMMNWPRIRQAFEEIAASTHEATPLEFPVMIGELERLKLLMQLRMLNGSPQVQLKNALQPNTGQYLSVEEVARRFHVTPRWLSSHKRKMPHSQPSLKLLLFPEEAITKWFAGRRRS